MAALADALSAHAPPEKPITIDWPDAIASTAGWSAAAGWPGRKAEEDEPPPWLVFGAMIRTVSMTGDEPGLHPLATALEEEGFDDVRSEPWWRASPATSWWRSMPGRRAALPRSPRAIWRGCRPSTGLRRDIDDNGDLLVRRMGKAEVERQPAGAARQTVLVRSGRRRDRAREAAAHHPARSVRHVRVRACGRAGRMGGVRRLRVLERRSRRARRQGARGVPQRLSRRRLARLVDAGADRRGERRRSRGGRRSTLAQQLVDAFRRARASPTRARRRRRKSPSRLAVRPSRRYADRGASQHEDGEIRETFRTLRPRDGRKAAARLLLPRGRRRGRAAGRGGRSASALARSGERK